MQIDRKVTQPYMGVWPRVGAGPSHSGDRTFSWVYSHDPDNLDSDSSLFYYKVTFQSVAAETAIGGGGDREEALLTTDLRDSWIKRHLMGTDSKEGNPSVT